MIVASPTQSIILNILLGVIFVIYLTFCAIEIKCSKIIRIICSIILLVLLCIIEFIVIQGLVTKIFLGIAIVFWIILIIRLEKEFKSNK